MRKLVQALLITLGCFSAAGVYANEEKTEAPEVVVTTETGSDEKKAELRLFQQEDETAEGEKTGNDESNA